MWGMHGPLLHGLNLVSNFGWGIIDIGPILKCSTTAFKSSFTRTSITPMLCCHLRNFISALADEIWFGGFAPCTRINIFGVCLRPDFQGALWAPWLLLYAPPIVTMTVRHPLLHMRNASCKIWGMFCLTLMNTVYKKDTNFYLPGSLGAWLLGRPLGAAYVKHRALCLLVFSQCGDGNQ